MKDYEELNLTVLLFPTEDVIRTSGVNGDDNEGGWDGGWDRI